MPDSPGSAKFTTAAPEPAGLSFTVIFCGQASEHWEDVTVTVNVHDADAPEKSVAVAVTVWGEPATVKVDPEAGLNVTCTLGSLSTTVGAGNATSADPDPAELSATLTFAGHVIVGAEVSLTVTLKRETLVLSLLEQTTAV